MISLFILNDGRKLNNVMDFSASVLFSVTFKPCCVGVTDQKDLHISH